ERVEQLEAGEPREQRAAAGCERHPRPDLARRDDVPLPDATGEGLCNVYLAAVRREANAVRRVEGIDHLPDERAVRPGVVDAAPVPIALADLAVVGEPEAAVAVEDQVVRAAQRVAVAIGVDGLHASGAEVDALDAAAAVARGLVARHREAC